MLPLSVELSALVRTIVVICGQVGMLHLSVGLSALVCMAVIALIVGVGLLNSMLRRSVEKGACRLSVRVSGVSLASMVRSISGAIKLHL